MGKKQLTSDIIEPRLATDVVVRRRGTIVIPAEMRKALEICDGQKLFVRVQDGDIVLHPVSSDPLERLREAAGDLFKGVDGVAYQRALRDEEDE